MTIKSDTLPVKNVQISYRDDCVDPNITENIDIIVKLIT
jgi:hypothetical protein